MVERFFKALKNMRSILGFRKVEFSSSFDDNFSMGEEMLENGFKRHYLRLNAVGKRDHIKVKGLLKVGVFIKSV